MNTIAYLAFVVACLAGAVGGGPIALYAAALFLPLLQVMPSPLGTISAPLHVLLISLFLSATTASAKRPKPVGSLPLKGPIVFMTSTLVLGLMIRAMRELGGDVFLNFLSDQPLVIWYWVTPFIVYAMVWRLATEQSVAWRVVRLCELSIAGEACITIYERAMGIGRATAHIGEANRAGAYFAAGACYFLARFLTARGRAKALYAAAWVVSIGGMFNSLSRGAMVATTLCSVLVVGVFFIKGKKRSGSKILFTVVATILLANAAVLIPQSVFDRVNSTFRGEEKEISADADLDASTEARLLFWAIAWDNFKVRPTGLGTGTFPTLVEPYWKRPMNAHNIYLQILTEYGIQGFVALLTLIGSVVVYLYRGYARTEASDRGETAFSLFGWWLAHCAAHMFVNPFFLIQGTGQFWIMTACLPHLSGSTETAPETAPDSKSRRPGRSVAKSPAGSVRNGRRSPA